MAYSSVATNGTPIQLWRAFPRRSKPWVDRAKWGQEPRSAGNRPSGPPPPLKFELVLGDKDAVGRSAAHRLLGIDNELKGGVGNSLWDKVARATRIDDSIARIHTEQSASRCRTIIRRRIATATVPPSTRRNSARLRFNRQRLRLIRRREIASGNDVNERLANVSLVLRIANQTTFLFRPRTPKR